MNCAKCNEPITPGKPNWNEVTGWEQDRDQGGTNHVALRKRTGRVMHESCMHLLRSGIDPGQQTLG